MNCTAKGNRRQNAARKKLESEGWLVYVAIRTKYQPIDILGLFDIIAYRDKKFKLIQVKSNYCPRAVKEQIGELKVDNHIVVKEVWVYKDFSRTNPWVEQIL